MSRTRLIWAASLIAVLPALVVGAAGLGYRLDLWGLGTAFSVLRSGVYGALAGCAVAAVALIAALARPPRLLAAIPVVGLCAAAVAAYIPIDLRQSARGLPPINDISTDLSEPPAFVAIADLRGPGDHPVAYPGEAFAAQQRAAYPDIGTRLTPLSPEESYSRSLAVAEEMGWEIVGAAPENGRFEAVDRTAWFGFRDDIVVRIRAEGDGSRIDIRSSSRVGRSDLGTNAKRIRAYLGRLDAALER